MEKWYTLYTKPNAEALVARTLTGRGLTVLLPLLPRGLVARLRPLFPAYLFVRCDLAVIGIETLQWVPGLRRVLSFGGRPAVVPDKRRADRPRPGRNQAAGGLPQHAFKPGDTVVIDHGPLAGYAASSGADRPAQRVRILVRFLGETNRAEVPVEALRRAGEEGLRPGRRRGTRGHGRQIHTRVDPHTVHLCGAEQN